MKLEEAMLYIRDGKEVEFLHPSGEWIIIDDYYVGSIPLKIFVNCCFRVRKIRSYQVIYFNKTKQAYCITHDFHHSKEFFEELFSDRCYEFHSFFEPSKQEN